MRTAVDPLSASRWLALSPEELLRGCKQSRYQGSGPGGQKRNRVYSGIRLVHEASGISIEADARRESRRNLEDALHRLRLEFALSVAAWPALPALPVLNKGPESADASSASRLEATSAFMAPGFRAHVSPGHADFPIFALRAIYFLDRHRGQASAAAQAMGCTASALARFLKADKALWTRAREIREANGLHPLK